MKYQTCSMQHGVIHKMHLRGTAIDSSPLILFTRVFTFIYKLSLQHPVITQKLCPAVINTTQWQNRTPYYRRVSPTVKCLRWPPSGRVAEALGSWSYSEIQQCHKREQITLLSCVINDNYTNYNYTRTVYCNVFIVHQVTCYTDMAILSICLSHSGIVSKWLHIYHQDFFNHLYAHQYSFKHKYETSPPRM